MDTAKINTLQQVNDAIATIDKATNDNNDPGTAITLGRISDTLQNIKNDIISKTEAQLVDAMSDSTTDLNNLVSEIAKTDAQLDKITNIIKGVSKVIGALVTITTTAMSAGLL